MDTSSSPADAGFQKRLLPARTRRPAAGVLKHEIDTMIFEAQKWRDTEVIIPESKQFLLATNPVHAQSSVEHDRVVKTVANERYFNRPAVIEAYRTQAEIQTPEFSLIDTLPTRMRARGNQPKVDDSDAAYERRHERYERFEVGMRHREKEKLQYEHHKLKERIDQLRGLDASAFLSFPADMFSPAPQQPPEEDLANAAGIYNTPAQVEGERRRKEMLEAANFLELRYRGILHTERFVRKPVRKLEPSALYENPSALLEGPGIPAASVNHVERPVKIKLPPKRSATTTPSAPSPSAISAPYTTSKKARIIAGPPAQEPLEGTRAELHSAKGLAAKANKDPLSRKRKKPLSPTSAHPLPYAAPFMLEFEVGRPMNTMSNMEEIQVSDMRTSMPAPPRIPGPVPSSSARVFQHNTEGHRYEEDRQISVSAVGRPKKRPRQSVAPPAQPTTPLPPPLAQGGTSQREHSLPPIESISSVSISNPRASSSVSKKGKNKAKSKETCILIHSARNNVSIRGKAPRHVTAFGVKLPSIINDALEFELPRWLSDFTPPPGGRTMVGREPDGSDESETDEDDTISPSEVDSQKTEEISWPKQQKPTRYNAPFIVKNSGPRPLPPTRSPSPDGTEPRESEDETAPPSDVALQKREISRPQQQKSAPSKRRPSPPIRDVIKPLEREDETIPLSNHMQKAVVISGPQDQEHMPHKAPLTVKAPGLSPARSSSSDVTVPLESEDETVPLSDAISRPQQQNPTPSNRRPLPPTLSTSS
ncbi:hypothetical protein FA15DRAFT_759679 [Coprinopsis marcescibilis]|uniref:Something about silencing protein 4 domain-containing protein n=1 Tax=Coprinopsis marcescibilis TaxID=230819 RepID=A0A5C3KI95_COPMA|nr:hypothetical protein FA15DRAFT_759679 [Coprinopsis marcescibilis]